MSETPAIIRPKFQSAYADNGVSGQLGPAEWNEPREALGGVTGDLFMRDEASPTGASWYTPDWSGTGGGSAVAQYDFSTQTVAPPTSSQIRFNAAAPYSGVTMVWIPVVTSGGTDVRAGLAAQPAGATLYVQDKNDGASYAKFTLTAGGTDLGSYFACPVAYVANGNALFNNQAVVVQFAGGGSPATVSGPFAARPTPGMPGRLYLPTDGYQLERDLGSAWIPWGPVFPLTPPDDTGFSWVNQGSSTLTTTKDAIVLRGAAVGNVNNLVARVKATPATPYTITAFLLGNPLAKPFLSYGLCVRESTSGKVIGFRASGGSPSSLSVTTYTTATSALANPLQIPIHAAIPWWRISDDGTTRTYAFSMDGQTWTTVYSEPRATFIVPNQIGFMADTQNQTGPNTDSVVTVLSWVQN